MNNCSIEYHEFYTFVKLEFIHLNSYNQITIAAPVTEVSSQTAEADVLKALSQIIDPDFGTDIVSCGFVKDLDVNKESGKVSQEIVYDDELFICIVHHLI